MASRTATNSLVKRTAFSSAINIFPNEVPPTGIAETENESTKNAHIRPYSEIPGPKGLPIIGNSWRFAPLIGKTVIFFSFGLNEQHSLSSIKMSNNTRSNKQRVVAESTQKKHRFKLATVCTVYAQALSNFMWIFHCNRFLC